jgi:amino acid adenylation domain-containing protein
VSHPASSSASSLQRQFWLLQRLMPETRAYHVGSVFRLRGHLDVRALEGAFEDLIARHAALRTTFEEHDGALRQRICPASPLDFEEIAIGVEPEGEEVKAELRRPFDLARGPLLHVRLWRRAPDDSVLAWTMHHIVCDLATKTMLAAELSVRYASRRTGDAPSLVLAPGTEQYPAFAAWEREWLASDAARRAEGHFAEQLRVVPPPLALPEDRPRPPVQSPRGARVTFELGSAFTGRLESASADWRTKPFLVLLTAYALLLSRYSEEERVVIGVPFSNRRREASQATVGCFVNALPVPVDRAGDPPFLELLRRIRATFLAHHRHQELPLERIVALCRPARDAGRNPLFQAGFTFEPPMDLALEGVEVTSFKAHAGGAQLDVFMTVWKGRDGFSGHLEYCVDLFHAATIERLLRNYGTLLERVLEPKIAETVPVSRLGILHRSERELVVRTWNATDVPYATAPLHELFLRQVERSPDAPALRMGTRRWSYRDLAGHARALALQLRASGVETGDRVGLYMERSFEMVTAILGTVLAGAAYVPIDPEYPPHRIQLMLEDAQPKCVLTHGDLARSWPQGVVPVRPVRLDELGMAAEEPPGAITPDDAAYVIFTSGSTGRPKGVVNSHRGIANRILWMQDAFRLGPSDVVLQKTPYSFDVSVWEFFWPLCAGAQLEIAPPGAHRDPGALAQLIRRAEVTTLHFVPSMLQVFLEHPDAALCRTLRRIVCSGEALSGELARRCSRLLEAELDNLYGPTEAAVDVSWWPCRVDLGRDPVPIGRPIANTRLYVLDTSGQPVPVGVPGELYIGGVQVALGYVNRQELTRERFVSDPFVDPSAAAPEARLYRTGDRARWNPDGTIGFLGRLDHQVKVRGLRIELGEIEAVLDQHPRVRQSVVVARPVDAMDSRLVAYVLPCDGAEGAALLSDALRAHAAERLPSYMVPHHLVVVEQLPLNANGKVDRKALPDAPAASPRGGLTSPRNEVERWLLGQSQELLGVELVGVSDNLFEAGGTSLMAAQLIGRIRRQFGAEVPLVRVFEHPTIEALAAHLGGLLAPRADPVDPLAKARERGERQRAHRSRLTRRRG